MVRREIGVPSKWSLAARILAERRAILARLAVLDRRRVARTQEWPVGNNTPTPEVMEAVQESLIKDIELASREALVTRLKSLARAEEKIRQGSYGRCDVCGQPIPPARLRALPEAVVCVPCAEPSPCAGEHGRGAPAVWIVRRPPEHPGIRHRPVRGRKTRRFTR